MEYDPFLPIKGGQNIADYMGYNYRHLTRKIYPQMRDYGLLWYHGNKTNSPLETTPFFINLYFILRNNNAILARDGEACGE